jgi:hypothetical protein
LILDFTILSEFMVSLDFIRFIYNWWNVTKKNFIILFENKSKIE